MWPYQGKQIYIEFVKYFKVGAFNDCRRHQSNYFKNNSIVVFLCANCRGFADEKL